jgi:hypothetical protein
MVTGAQNAQASVSGTRLFGRAMTLTIGFLNDPSANITTVFNEQNSTGWDSGGIDGLDVDFVVDKSLKPTDPNTCAIKVYNLSPTSRQSLSGSPKLTVKLEAGYVGGVTQLYFAEARSAWTVREGADYITHIESSDTIARPTGVRTTKKATPGSPDGNLYRAYGPRVPLADAFQAIAGILGVGAGNLSQALAGLNNKPLPLSAVNGAALLGNGVQRMTDICRSAGLEWSIQDGVLQFLNIGQALSGSLAVDINAGTGMIGSPSVDSSGAVSVSTLLIPGLAPGILINMSSLFVSGGYRIEKIRYQGETRGKPWYAHIDAVRY